MPDIYEVEIGGEIYEVEASDPQTAYQIGEQYAKSPQIRPHKPGVVERGLSALSEAGPVPAMISGALRDIAGPVSKAAYALRPALPETYQQVSDFYWGNQSRLPPEPVNPDEQLGAGLSRGASLLSLPSAAPALASGAGRATQALGAGLEAAGRSPGIVTAGTTLAGAAPGIMSGNLPVAAGGAMVGFERGPAIAARLGEAGRRLRGPVPQPGARVVPGSGTPPALENELLSVLDELRTPQTPPRTPEAVRVAPTSPAGGGYTIPPELPPAAAAPRPKRPPPTPPAPAAAAASPRHTPVRQEPARAAQPTPEDWRGDYTSRKARERTYLGEERTLSLPELEDAYRNAVRSGDEARIAYFESRLRQRSHITIDEIKRRVREEMKGTP